MFVFIPLGGTGQRFKTNGYTSPKAWIRVFGKPILQWVIDSILTSPPKDLEFVYIAYNREYVSIRLEDQLRKLYPDMKFKFFPLISDTRGAAETMRLALDALEVDDQPLLHDGDTLYNGNLLTKWLRITLLFTSKMTSQPIFSYVVKDADGHLTDIVSQSFRRRMQGCYAFSSWKTARREQEI